MTLGTVTVGAAPSEPLVLFDARSVWEASSVMRPYAARFKDLDWNTIVCIPLAWENRVSGVLSVSLPASISGPSEAELAFYTALADQVVAVVTSARLKSQTAQIAATLERSHLARNLHDSWQPRQTSTFPQRSTAASPRRASAASTPAVAPIASNESATRIPTSAACCSRSSLRPGARRQGRHHTDRTVR